MKEHPILFTGPMVRAILEGRKTQTRRPIKPPKGLKVGFYRREGAPPQYRLDAPEYYDFVAVRKDFDGLVRRGDPPLERHAVKRPFAVGDRLWVREGVWLRKHEVVYGNTCYDGKDYEHSGWECDKSPGSVWYAADGEPMAIPEYGTRWDWRPSIHMPRWASRITLEVVDVRPKRVKGIPQSDAIAEGIEYRPAKGMSPGGSGTFHVGEVHHASTAREAFALLWDSIYGGGPLAWAENPWAWATTFKVVAQ